MIARVENNVLQFKTAGGAWEAAICWQTRGRNVPVAQRLCSVLCPMLAETVTNPDKVPCIAVFCGNQPVLYQKEVNMIEKPKAVVLQ